MTTKISYRASSNLTSAPPSVRVKETVAEVVRELDIANDRKAPFFVATDADTEKEISVKTKGINDIAEE